MNKDIIINISKELNITNKQVESVLKLLMDGNTIPFIARYRKEATGALNEEVIRRIDEVYRYSVNLWKRKEDVIRLINDRGMLTDSLRDDILKCEKLVDVEDLYRPYKEKRKTKASEAIALGLEMLSDYLLKFPVSGVQKEALKYVNDKVKSVEDALDGAKYIIAERISDNAKYRKYIRTYIMKNGFICSHIKKNAHDDNKVYEIYYDYKEAIKSIKPHRVLALNRGEEAGVLSLKILVEDEVIINYLIKQVVGCFQGEAANYVISAIEYGYNRLIFPSIERDIRSELSLVAENVAIDNFANNVECLLLTPPIKEKVVLGYDPAFRTGCKLAVLDKFGNPLDISVIYPLEPHNKWEESKKIVLDLINKYSIDIIAIGNGTASRESEEFIMDVISSSIRKVSYSIVNEAGASVYSASSNGISEFPYLTVEKRSAISIGRRLQDALSELVKIDPKSIGVGLYQHDVTPKKLDDALNFVVSKVVNQVGVNINIASRDILNYVSGLNKRAIDGIIDYRNAHGKIKSRRELAMIKGLTPKVYEQSVGFMRIVDGDNPLDKTSIHPEHYNEALQVLDKIGCSVDDIGCDKLLDRIANFDMRKEGASLNIDSYTLGDIVDNLKKPIRDPRDDMSGPFLRSDILRIEDVHVGDKLHGVVRNVVDFGAFVDVGLHNDGLIHISKISKDYVKHPSDVLSVGDKIDCYVVDVSLDKGKISLSLFND